MKSDSAGKNTAESWHVTYQEKYGTYFVEKSHGDDVNLIASAPAMLAMLKRVLKNLKSYQRIEYYFLIQEVEEVISKAEKP